MSRYVKAVYEFNTTEAGEIALKVGDVIHVVKQVDGNWLKVKLKLLILQRAFTIMNCPSSSLASSVHTSVYIFIWYTYAHMSPIYAHQIFSDSNL